MKIINPIAYLALVLIFFVSSCSMEKRVYRAGYHIKWKNKPQTCLNHDGKKQDKQDTETAANNCSEELREKSLFTFKQKCDSTSDEHLSISDKTEHKNSEIDLIENQQKSIWRLSSIRDIRQETRKIRAEAIKENERILASIEEPRTNGMALTGFICSLTSIFLTGFIGAICGIIFSVIGMNQIKKNPGKWSGKSFAIAGLIIGIVDLAIWLLLVAFLIYVYGFY